MARVLIGLIGKKGSGKTTCYNIIKDELAPVQEVQLAKKLKDVCSKVFNINRTSMDDPIEKEMDLHSPVKLTLFALLKICFYFLVFPKIRTFKHIGQEFNTPRRVLQYIGTDVLRDIDPQIHLKRALWNLPKHGVFVASDVRFKDEMEYLHAWAYPYGWFFYVDRNVQEIDFHASEAEVRKLKKLSTRVINNKGSIKQLLGEIQAALVWVANELPYIGYGPYKRQLERVKNQKWKSSRHS